MTESKLYKIYCQECKSECEIEHEMDDHHYPIQHCPFCGAELDEDELHEIEVIDDDNPYEI